jgi:hypothetical protein
VHFATKLTQCVAVDIAIMLPNNRADFDFSRACFSLMLKIGFQIIERTGLKECPLVSEKKLLIGLTGIFDRVGNHRFSLYKEIKWAYYIEDLKKVNFFERFFRKRLPLNNTPLSICFGYFRSSKSVTQEYNKKTSRKSITPQQADGAYRTLMLNEKHNYI